jgi:eukaryotic-like serine/threonine-protein kinase
MLRAGDRLGPYEVVYLLGSGGMGEVYRARDARLNRDVALKVLPDRHRLDSHRVSRLEHEARALAAVSHPNIATLYGIEQADGVQALVMEHVDGDTLADRIAIARRAHGAGLPMAEATDIARQVADALEAAHERGIVHRDLKPANIKVRADGTVKVLDFGLASDGQPAVDSDSEHATATTSHAWGAVVGTPAYMSPEQARGAAVDRRADVWAFGCVLYEMVTGRRAFEGATSSDVLARVLEREPEFEALPRDTPPSVRRVLRRTLVKDPRRRLHDIADARLELVDADPTDTDAALQPREPTGTATHGRVTALVVAMALVAIGVAGWLALARSTPPSRAARFELQLPASAPLRDGADETRLFALSPDGTRIAYLTTKGLAIRALDQLQVKVLEVQSLGAMPFFSKDGKWVGATGDGLRKVSADGGPVIHLADTGPGAVGAWGDHEIFFADTRGLFRIPAGGGTPRQIPLDLQPNEQVTFPEPLPGDQVVLFTVVPTRSNTLGSSSRSSGARIEAVELATGRRTVIVSGGGRPRYLPSGHLVYNTVDALSVVPFDADRLAPRGEPIRLVEGSSEFAVSDTGTLVYGVGLVREKRTAVWVDRRGHEEPVGLPPAEYAYARLSPDGTRIALDVVGPDRDIWMWDTGRRVLERFTSDPTENVLPAWSPDGRYLAFASGLFGVPNIHRQATDGSGAARRLVASTRLQQALSFVSDGRLLVSEAVPGRGRDIKVLDLRTRALEGLLESPANELGAVVSPDRRWIAYISDESGQFEVYVRPYPHVDGGRWKVSSNGGRSPLWSRSGSELFYQDFGGAVIAIPATPSRSFVASEATTIIPASRTYVGYGSAIGGRPFDVSLDGKRFLMLKNLGEGQPSSLVVVQNWITEIRDRLSTR